MGNYGWQFNSWICSHDDSPFTTIIIIIFNTISNIETETNTLKSQNHKKQIIFRKVSHVTNLRFWGCEIEVAVSIVLGVVAEAQHAHHQGIQTLLYQLDLSRQWQFFKALNNSADVKAWIYECFSTSWWEKNGRKFQTDLVCASRMPKWSERISRTASSSAPTFPPKKNFQWLEMSLEAVVKLLIHN